MAFIDIFTFGDEAPKSQVSSSMTNKEFVPEHVVHAKRSETFHLTHLQLEIEQHAPKNQAAVVPVFAKVL